MRAAIFCPHCQSPIEAETQAWAAATQCCPRCGKAIERTNASSAVLLAPDLDDELSPDFDDTRNWDRANSKADSPDPLPRALPSIEVASPTHRRPFVVGAIVGAATTLLIVLAGGWVFIGDRATPASSAAAVPESGAVSPPAAAPPFGSKQAKELQIAWSQHRGIPLEITNSLGMKLVLVPATSQTAPFYLGVYEVTQSEYQAIAGANPSHFSANGPSASRLAGVDVGRLPVENLTLEDAKSFCRSLSQLSAEKAAGRRYRLPTIDEWSFACLAGSSGHYHTGDGVALEQANFNGLYASGGEAQGSPLARPATVGSYPANAFGLHDMHGNVAEFCVELRAPRGVNPAAAKGGAWWHSAPALSVRELRHFPVGHRAAYDGFRVALPIDPENYPDEGAKPIELADISATFPMQNATMLFSDDTLALSAWNDADELFVQAVVSSDAPAGALNDRHSGILAIDVDGDRRPTPLVDRSYCVKSKAPRLHYHWLQTDGALSEALLDSEAQGGVAASDAGERRGATYRFIVPLAEIRKRPGDEVRFVFVSASADSFFKSNSAGLPHSETLDPWKPEAIEKHHSWRLLSPSSAAESLSQ